jgi:hypothetical protein
MQKKALRIITYSRYNDHTVPLFVNEKILPLEYIIIQAKLKFMHSMKFKYGPKSFNEVFVLNNVDDLTYDLRYPNEFDVPFARIELFKRIPLYALPIEWNSCEDLCFYQNVTTFNIVLFETLIRLFAINNDMIGEH